MMKNDKTESEIFSRIKESLENYEEAYIPGSWENFMQQRTIHKRKIFLRIATGVAACLLAGFLGINYFEFEKGDKTGVTAEVPAKTFIEQPDPGKSIVKQSPSSELMAHSDMKKPGVAGDQVSEYAGRKKSFRTEKQQKEPVSENVTEFKAQSADQSALPVTGPGQTSAIHQADTAKNSPDTTKIKTQNFFLNTPQTIDNKHLATAEQRKVRIGLNFSPGVSTTESSSSLNYMAGVSADISLTSRVALSTGLQVENQSFVKKMPGIVASSAAPVNQTKTTLTNLDFPVNVTWKFASEKTHAYYVSAGLSSLVYLSQENKITTYTQDLIPVSSLVNGEEIKTYSLVSQKSVTQDAVSPAQTFDLAGRINLMVGYEKKLSDRIYIHFEPYAKIPTSGQSAGSLNHPTTGINFKVSF